VDICRKDWLCVKNSYVVIRRSYGKTIVRYGQGVVSTVAKETGSIARVHAMLLTSSPRPGQRVLGLLADSGGVFDEKWKMGTKGRPSRTATDASCVSSSRETSNAAWTKNQIQKMHLRPRGVFTSDREQHRTERCRRGGCEISSPSSLPSHPTMTPSSASTTRSPL
jgi:hypothetical protein